ncbi:hypothetical protein AMECASPLE_034133 [Ameca splendens]|uniref:Uncharacterized protein n=1 Tax=Ameca splendens TaxID=208324 RepID=A0ABV0XK19_9TELE
MPQPAPCLTSLVPELDPVSVHRFTPQPSHWFIQAAPAWISIPSEVPGFRFQLATAKTSSFLAQDSSEPCPPSDVLNSEPGTYTRHSDPVEYNFKQAQNSSIRPHFVSLSYKAPSTQPCLSGPN